MANIATDFIGGRGPAGAYSAIAKILHWLMALAIFILVPVAVAMLNLPDGALKDALFEVHKSVGITAFVLVLVRIAVRLTLGVPPYEEDLPRFTRVASLLVHRTIYAILLVMPMLGYVATNMCCKPVNLFWTVPMPLNFEGSEATVNAIFRVHMTLGWVLVALVAVHVAAALWHHFVRRDGVLSRMLP